MTTDHEQTSRVRGILQGLSHRETWIFRALLALALTANILPLSATEFLPFSDLPGHLGVVGAILHAHSPAAHIDRFYSLNPHFGPNGLEFGLLLLLGKVLSLTTAARIVVALSVTLLPLSVLAMLTAFRKNPWLVFLSLPFAYPRILWYGFVGASIGVSLMFFTLASARMAATGKSLWMAMTAATLCFLSGLAHPFFLAATVGLFSIVWIGSLLGQPRSWKAWVVGMVPLPSLLIFGHWFAAMAGGKASQNHSRHQSIIDHVLSKRPALHVYRQWLEQWSLNGFADRWLERGILLILAASVLFMLLSVFVTWTLALRHRRRGTRDQVTGSNPSLAAHNEQVEEVAEQNLHHPRECIIDADDTDDHQGAGPGRCPLLTELIPWALLAATGAAYLILPGVITYPVYWWAVSQRLVTPLLLLILLVLPSSVPAKIARIAGLAGMVLGLVYASFLTRDFKQHFADREMAGFHELVDMVPPGKRLCGLYDDREQHYAHFPLHFASAYYVALRGGFAMPFPVVAGYKSIAWAYPKKIPPSPPWGKLRAFSRRRHGRFYDYFLIKKNIDGKTRWRRRLPKRCFRTIASRGLWVLVKKTTAPGC